jgi:hypothetical protein
LTAIPDRVLERVLVNADRDIASGCLISRYSVGSHGYAQIGWWADGKSHMVLAHRAAWIAQLGEITAGMTLDHTCKKKKCIEVDHLRELTNYENARRHSGRDWPLGQCARGHDDTHLVQRGRHRVCGLCAADDQAAYLERKAS